MKNPTAKKHLDSLILHVIDCEIHSSSFSCKWNAWLLLERITEFRYQLEDVKGIHSHHFTNNLLKVRK